MKLLKLFILIFWIALICALLVLLAFLNFWLVAGSHFNLLYLIYIFLSFAIFLASSWLALKLNYYKKENHALRRLLEDNEKKIIFSEREKIRAVQAFLSFWEGILIIDENGRIAMINPRAKQILKINSKETKGMSARELCRLSRLSVFLPYFSSDSFDFKKEVELGGLVLEISVLQLIFSEQKMGKMIILRDKTAEVFQEKERKDFLLSVAHEVKTAASSAKWSLRMLLLGDFGKIRPEQAKIIEGLYQKNQNLISFVDNLMDASKIEDGISLYNKKSADIESLVRSAIFSFQDKIKGKKIKLRFKKPKKAIPKIKIDKEKISSAIQNLFDNALKYTREGDVIAVSLDSSAQGGSASGGEVKFSIKDTGIGIPENQRQKIFSKFFRASNAGKSGASGSGLGLFIVKKTIEGHGGKIWFESKEGKGSVFFFTLPIKSV